MSKTTYKMDEYGHMVETQASIKRHVAEAHGFQFGRIKLMEASYRHFESNGHEYCYCDGVYFNVNGLGFYSNLTQSSPYLVMVPAYND